MAAFYTPKEITKLFGSIGEGSITIEKINKMATEDLKCPATPKSKTLLYTTNDLQKNWLIC